MSMNNYPIVEYGLILKENELIDLFKKYNGENKNEIIKCLKQEDFEDILYNYADIFDVLYNVCGNFESLNGENEKNFNEEALYILYLDKFNVSNNNVLFQKYENIDEIYTEISKKLIDFGFYVDNDFLKNNIGKAIGTNFS